MCPCFKSSLRFIIYCCAYVGCCHGFSAVFLLFCCLFFLQLEVFEPDFQWEFYSTLFSKWSTWESKSVGLQFCCCLKGFFFVVFFLKIAMSSTLLFQGRNANWDLTHFAEIFCYLVIFAFIDIKRNSTLKDILKAAL